MNMKKFLVLAFSVVLAGSSMAKPTVAILPFDIVKDSVTISPYFIKVEQVEAQTKLITTDFITFLQKSKKFDLVERDRMDDILKEHDFAQSDSVDPKKALQVGKMLNADYLVMGKIEKYFAKAVPKSRAYSRHVDMIYSGGLIVNLRIVDSKTGKIVKAEKINGLYEEKKGKESFLFLERLKENAVKQMVNAAIDGVFPLKIIKSNGDEVYLNRGDGAGYSIGDVFDVFNLGEDLIDPDTKENLGNEEVFAAQVQITSIQNKFSKGAIIKRRKDIKAGAILRKAKPVEPMGNNEKMTPGSSDKPVNW